MKVNKLKRYDAYKPSGVEWLGEIPEHWGVEKIKYLFKEINERSFNGEEDLLSVSQYTGVTKKSEEINEGDFITNANTLEGYKKVSINDLVSNIMLAWNGSLGFSPYNGITSPAYSVYRLNGINNVGFFHYLFRTDLYKAEFKRNSSGVVESRLRLYTEKFFGIPAIHPPFSEQTAIAQFLDTKTALIDKAVALKEKQIELLKERRQAIIHQAVTKGLNPDVPMKDSGIEWIGEMPAHWKISKLKYNSTVQSGITLGKSYANKNLEQVPYLRVANVQAGYFKLEDIAFLNLPAKEIDKYLIRNGDILVTEGGDLDKLGRGAVWKNQILKCLHQNHVFAIRMNYEELDPEYVSLLMESDYGRKYFTNTANKTTNLASTNSTKLGNFPLILPPGDERDLILAFIQDTNNKINNNIGIKEREIEKLKEYKASLINSAVTGKIKVA